MHKYGEFSLLYALLLIFLLVIGYGLAETLLG